MASPCTLKAVSYTHLDVYKRQIVSCGSFISLIGAFVAGALGLTMNSSTSASLPVRHLRCV